MSDFPFLPAVSLVFLFFVFLLLPRPNFLTFKMEEIMGPIRSWCYKEMLMH